MLLISSCGSVFADDYTAKMTGHYRHPVTQVIEDSGGEGSYALGQSMVDNITSEDVYIQTIDEDTAYATFTFYLMNSIKDVEFKIQNEGDTEWTDVEHEVIREGDDESDLRVPLTTPDTLMRCTFYVIPMGRTVIFYITLDDRVEGNNTSFEAVSGEIGGTSAGKLSETKYPELEGAEGLVIGSGDGSSDPDKSKTEQEENLNDEGKQSTGSGFIIDDSIWLALMMLVFCANVLSGLVLMGIYFAVKKMKGNSSVTRRTRKRKHITTSAEDMTEDEDILDMDDALWMEDDDE